MLSLLSRSAAVRLVLFLAACDALVTKTSAEPPTKAQLDSAVVQAFKETANGFSSDEVLLDDARCEAFFAAVRDRAPDADAAAANSTLLRLRKAGKLKAETTRRGRAIADDVFPVAEIATRQVMDQHEATTDQILADPELRTALQQAAAAVQPGVDAYSVRKAMIRLRKTRRLSPELVLRVADWQRDVRVWKLAQLRRDIEQLPALPGVYLFRDADGYVYIGEAQNLRQRLQQHLAESDRAALANYLAEHSAESLTIETHAFPGDSPARRVTVRRAYESEMIRSRNPRLNVRP